MPSKKERTPREAAASSQRKPSTISMAPNTNDGSISHQTPASILRLQAMVGNSGTSELLNRGELASLPLSRTVVQRDDAPSQPATSGAVAADVDVKPSVSLDDVASLIMAQFQTIYERQLEAMTRLATDLSKADEPSLADTIIKAAIQAALGQALTQLGTLIGTAASNAASSVIVSRALKKVGDSPVMGLTPEDIAKFDTERSRATATNIATMAGAFVGDKLKSKVPEVYASLSSTSGAKTKFLEGHRLSLINDKSIRNDVFVNQVKPELRKLPENESVVAAQRYLEGLKVVDAQGIDIQYLSSVAQWAEALRGGATDQSFQLSVGNQGILTIEFSASSPGGACKIIGVSMSGVQQSIIDRIKSTDSLKARILNELPMAKLYRMSDPAVQIQIPPGASTVMDTSRDIAIGQAWLAQRADSVNGVTGSSAFAGALALSMEFGTRTLGSLGDIKQG